MMKSVKSKLAVSALVVMTAMIVGGILAQPVVAQIRAALVRDVDNPALAPFTGAVSFTFNSLNDQRLLVTVPAGKRLVIEQVTYWTYGPVTDELVFAGLRSGQFGPFRQILEVRPPHFSATSSLYIQDASLPSKTYFEAGEEVWVSASKNTGGFRTFELYASGYYVTP